MRINRAVFTEIIKILQINGTGKTQPEIERRFLIKSLPLNLAQYHHQDIEQGYLETKDGTSVRLRKLDDKYYQTTKIGTGKIRIETEIEITEKLHNELWHLTKGQRLGKTRYEIPHKDGIIQLDIYHGKLKGLVTAEIEFDSEEACDKFVPPDWFSKEVTNERDYTNKSIATNGIPKGTPLHK